MQQANITILNFYAPNDSLKVYKEKVTELKGEIEKHKIVAGDFNMCLAGTVESRQDISKDIEV